MGSNFTFKELNNHSQLIILQFHYGPSTLEVGDFCELFQRFLDIIEGLIFISRHKDPPEN